MNAIHNLFASPWPWVIGAVVLAGLEIVGPGVYLLWIGLGALVVGLAVLVAPELPLSWQLLVFAVAMLGSTSLGFAIQRRSRSTPPGTSLNQELDGLVGRQAQAIAAFSGGRGRIRVGDSSYAAASPAAIAEGQDLVITARAADGSFQVMPLAQGTGHD